MAWIESHQEIAHHPKTLRLARLLGVSLAQTIGHLHLIWWWCLSYADDGDLSELDEQEIADAARWEGDADKFLGALIKSGWIENGDAGRLVHDWHDYAGKLIERRRANAKRKRAARAVRETSAGRPRDGRRTGAGRQ